MYCWKLIIINRETILAKRFGLHMKKQQQHTLLANTHTMTTIKTTTTIKTGNLTHLTQMCGMD